MKKSNTINHSANIGDYVKQIFTVQQDYAPGKSEAMIHSSAVCCTLADYQNSE